MKKLEIKIIFIYAMGIVLWFLIWFLSKGFEHSTNVLLLWFPFAASIIILLANLILWLNLDKKDTCDDYDKELEKLQLVERNAAHMVTAITGALLIATAISATKHDSPIPEEVIIFESIAFICAVAGVLPKYWIPSKKPQWLVILRHLKTVPFTYSISFFLGGLISLLNWL